MNNNLIIPAIKLPPSSSHGLLGILDLIQEHRHNVLLEQSNPGPLQCNLRTAHLRLNVPERLWLEHLDLIVSLNTEPESGRLTGTIRDERGIQVPVLALKELCLVPSECTSDPEIQLLPCIHTLGLVLVRTDQVGHGVFNVLFSDRRELGPEGDLIRVDPADTPGDSLHHLKADILSLLIAIQPQDEIITTSRGLSQERRHPHLWICLLLLSGTGEEFYRVHSVPGIVLAHKVQGHDVATDGTHLEEDRLSVEFADPFVDRTGFVATWKED